MHTPLRDPQASALGSGRSAIQADADVAYTRRGWVFPFSLIMKIADSPLQPGGALRFQIYNGTVPVAPVVVAPSPVVVAPAVPVVVAPMVCPYGYYLGPYGRCLLNYY